MSYALKEIRVNHCIKHFWLVFQERMYTGIGFRKIIISNLVL